jgi:hypothetical protein
MELTPPPAPPHKEEGLGERSNELIIKKNKI